MIERRSLLAGLAGTAAAAAIAPTALAQAAKKRVAIASPTVATELMLEGMGGDPGWFAFFAELKAQGFDSNTVTFERYSGAQFNYQRRLQGTRWNGVGVAIANAKPDVVFATSSYIARGVSLTADTIPVVFMVGDAKGAGLVEELDKPGGNLTGVSAIGGPAWEATRMELLREAVPAAAKVAYLIKSQTISPTAAGQALLASARAGAQKAGATLEPAYIDDLLDDAGLDGTAHLRAILEAAKKGAQGLVVAETLDTTEYAAMMGGVALTQKLPGIAPWRDFVIGGGLMSYGPNMTEMYKSGAQILARVLKGEKPGNIPVVRPQADLVISQRNARHLGVTLPQSIVSKAKEMLT